MEAAAAVIAEKGYEGATMAEIAARSGTKIGSLYRFFPNKESLADTPMRWLFGRWLTISWTCSSIMCSPRPP